MGSAWEEAAVAGVPEEEAAEVPEEEAAEVLMD